MSREKVVFALLVCASACSAAVEPGFVSLFNGRDLSGWEGATNTYCVSREGYLTCVQNDGKGGSAACNLWTEREYTNFVLRFDIKLPPDANNGVGLRTRANGWCSREGMEIQLLDDWSAQYRRLKPDQFTGAIYGVVAPKRKPNGESYVKRPGEWNSVEVAARGTCIRVKVNGTVVVCDDVARYPTDASRDGVERPGLHNRTGRIHWCGHGHNVFWRNIRIRELPASPTEALFDRLVDLGKGKSFAYAWSTSGTEWLRTNGFDRIREASGGATPLLYFAEFRDIGGTWYPKARYDALRAAFARHAKREYAEHGSVPLVTWHVQNPYIPPKWTSEKYGENMGMRYFYWAEGYPMEHRYVLREIAEGTGSLCGTGRIDGVNARAFPNPRAWWEWCLKDVAAFCRTLTGPNGERIPIVFRPFHECDGDWFWWGPGSATPADYIAAFRFTVEVLRRELGRENVLFCYSPDRTWRDLGEVGKSGYLERYPGDDCVDLIGLDDYSIGQADASGGSESTTVEAIRRLRLLSAEAERRGKVCGVYETGALNAVDGFYSILHRVMTAPGVKCALIATYDGQWTFPKTEAGKTDMRRFFTYPEVMVDRR